MLSTEAVPAGQVSLKYYYTVTLLPLWDMTESNPKSPPQLQSDEPFHS